MLRPISRSIIPWLLAASCGSGANGHVTSVAEHEHMASHYEATAASIEIECYKARRHELTVDDPAYCWKANDVRFLQANRNAAAEHRAEAERLRGLAGVTSRSATR